MSQPETISAEIAPCAEPGAPRFYDYPTEEGPEAGHGVPDAEDALQAATGFLECWGPTGDGLGDEVSVTVIDCGTGEQVCYRVTVDTGTMRPC